jgi:peptide/nickel transport system permease protein
MRINVLPTTAKALLGLVLLTGICAPLIAPHGFAEMSREEALSGPSKSHLLGTDEEGRDRFSRLIYGIRISLILAPLAAVATTLIAVLLGALAARRGGLVERTFLVFSDALLCIPWMFLLISVRALLPLNADAGVSVSITFLLLASLGWAGSARVVRVRVRSLLAREDQLWRRASGIMDVRALFVHIAPNLWPVMKAQFWLAVPAFILSESNLSMIGLGVSEPLPSLGNLIHELENIGAVRDAPWLLAPLVVLVLVLLLIHAATNQNGNEAI